ncbi:MAG TPA: M48 family metallopeptidase [Clostridiales bacterium]|nr:M48 family metallopeptidase [Clostridiales bacterium]
MEYELKRSKRKTLAIEITRNGNVVVRAPKKLPLQEIERFLLQKSAWIAKHQVIQRQRMLDYPEPSPEELKVLAQQARQYIPRRVEHYANIMGLSPSGIRITAAKTRFGSCSYQNRLCFSCRLMAYPPEAIDYVVVHELAHINHKNHGKEFYALVSSILPDYRERKALLKR